MQMCRDEREKSGNQKICSPYQLAFKAPLPGEPVLSLGTSCGGLAPETAAWSKLPWRTLGRGVCGIGCSITFRELIRENGHAIIFVCYNYSLVLGYLSSDIEASEDVRNMTESSLLFLEQSEPSQCLSPPQKWQNMQPSKNQ